MFLKKIGLTGLFVGLGLATAGCTDGYGYSGLNVGVGNGGYYDDGYGYGYAGGYPGYGGFGGYGYAPSYFGWYNDYYYPGTGSYVYDRNRQRYRWNDGQRRYWEGRRGSYRGNGQIRDNWADFRRDVRREQRDYRGDLRDNRQAYRNGTIDRDQFRDGRRDARREFRQDTRRDYRDTRRENREVRQANPGAGTRALRTDRPFGGRGGGRRPSDR
ncbi:hypothetical protein [Sphingomonas sp. 1P08PE]|uniref:hypothetical protein n=1 Tax=Sphingomonas sp. 1P08PE TaxID=554122 RepID=UPI0039A100CC